MADVIITPVTESVFNVSVTASDFTNILPQVEILAEQANTSAINSEASKVIAVTKAGEASASATASEVSAQSLLSQKDQIGGIALFDTSICLIDDLSTISSFDRKGRTALTVKDLDRGGSFTYVATGLVANGGTIFSAFGGGFWVRNYSGAINVKWFGAKGDGTTDDSAAFTSAYGSTVFNNIKIQIPKGTFIIKSPIIIPCGGSLVGEGAGSIIKADFGAWVGTDYRAIIVKSKEGVNYNGIDYNGQIRDFSLFGINNSTLISIGIDFRASNVISVASAVNYSWYNGIMTDVLISGFDTGINILEMWNSTLRNINVMYCRQSCLIFGKAVNVTFDQIRFTNHGLTNTSSVSNTEGLTIRSGFHYSSGSEGRPEGIVVTPGSLFFGASTNINVINALYFRVSKSIIDGATGTSIKINSADNIEIDGNYIYSSGASSSCIDLLAVAVPDSKISIINNHFVGNGVNSIGVNSFAGVRNGCTVSNNFFRGFLSPIKLNNFNNGIIIGNYGKTNVGSFIYSQSGGDHTVIDGNVSDDSYSIVALHPSSSERIDIRNNKSVTSKTYYKGKVTMLAGATTISLPSNFHTSIQNYVYSITIATPNKNIGNFWITNSNSITPSATLTVASPIAADTVIYYSATATVIDGL